MTASADDVPGRIFISYRRDDTSYAAAGLHHALIPRFGEEQVFIDIDSIAAGDDATEAIRKAVASCDVLLALIGPKWLTVTEKGGRRRLDNPADFIRLEIEVALTRNVRVIPILCDGASMPRADVLPDSLAKLADRQAVKLRPDRLRADTEELLQELDKSIAKARPQARQAAGRTTSPQHPADELSAGSAGSAGAAGPPSVSVRTAELPADGEAGASPVEGTRRASRLHHLLGRGAWQRPRVVLSVIAGVVVLALVIVGVPIAVSIMSGSGGSPSDYTGSGGSDTSAENVKWSADTNGSVTASPVVAGGVVYAGSGDDLVYALNAATGTQNWSFPTGGAVSSRPAVAGGTVYVGSDDDKVYAIDASTGSQRWVFRTRKMVRSGPAVGPAGKGGTVYVGSDDGNLYALNAANGLLRWFFPTGEGVNSNPVVAGGVVYFGSGDDNVYAIDASTGKKRWFFHTGGVVSSGPAVAKGTVYVAGDDGTLYALNAANGHRRWSYRPSTLYAAYGPVVEGGLVFFSGDRGTVYALDAATGDVRWSRTISTSSTASAPAVAGGVVYVGTGDNRIYALDAATSQVRWHKDTFDVIASSPAAVEDTAFVAEGFRIDALALKP